VSRIGIPANLKDSFDTGAVTIAAAFALKQELQPLLLRHRLLTLIFFEGFPKCIFSLLSDVI
jgi:hypothetical protein